MVAIRPWARSAQPRLRLERLLHDRNASRRVSAPDPAGARHCV